MSSKVVLLLAVLCVSLSLSSVTANRPRLLGALTGGALVKKACHGIGKYEPECLKLLGSSDKLDKGEAMDLAFFALRYTEGQAVNVTVQMKKAASEADIEPLFQSALSECTEQYNSLDDLIEDGINAMLAMANSDSSDFIEAAISSTDMCGNQLQSSIDKEKNDPDSKDAKSAQALKYQNDFIEAMLYASLNILAVNV